MLAERCEGKRLNAPNDIAVRKDGNVYFTDPAFGYQSDTRELDFYGVYQITTEARVEAGGEARRDGRTGSRSRPTGRCSTWRTRTSATCAPTTWTARARLRASGSSIAKTDGIPDGLRTDEKGNLYVAADGVGVYSPQGKQLGTIPVPEKPSGCAFGDDSLLFITARTAVYLVKMAAESR